MRCFWRKRVWLSLSQYHIETIPSSRLTDQRHFQSFSCTKIEGDVTNYYTETVINEHVFSFAERRQKEYDGIKTKEEVIRFNRFALPAPPNSIGSSFILGIKDPEKNLDALKLAGYLLETLIFSANRLVNIHQRWWAFRLASNCHSPFSSFYHAYGYVTFNRHIWSSKTKSRHIY